MNRNRILCTILAFFTLISCLPSYLYGSDSKDDAHPSSRMESTVPVDTNRLLIKYKNQKKNSLSKDNITKKLKNIRFQHYNKLSGTEIVEFSNVKELESAVKLLEGDSNVEYVQPDYKLYKNGSIQDPDFKKQWGLSNSGQEISGTLGLQGFDINVTSVWDNLGINNNILLGVLDTGIDINHEDLKDSIYKNPYDISNTYDDDNNGYLNDYCGWDFINSDNSVYDGAEDAHGTHIAGIIAAGANTIGIRGVASGVKIVPLKFMNGMAGYTSDLLEAIEYAKKIGVKILNCSFSDTHYNYALEQAIKNSGMLFVCSAGNDNSNTPSYPASFRLPNLISVGAVNNNGSLAPFSNYGQFVDVAAPGVGIYSTLPNNSYGFSYGTSVAAPFVSGIAALLLSYNSNFSAYDLSNIIKSTVNTKFTNLNRYIASGGIVDAKNALEYAKTYIPPVSPTNTVPVTSTVTPSPTPTVQPGTWTVRSGLDCGCKILSKVSLNDKIYAIDSNGNIHSYDPGTDKWTKSGTVDSNMIDLNHKPILVTLGNKIYIIAGSTKNVYEYDPSSGKINSKASTLFNRMGGAAVTYDDKIYISGGEDPLSAKTFEVYNPSTDSWSPLPDMQYERSSHCIAVCGTKIYSMGGNGYPGIVEEYDINEGKWTTLSRAPLAINSIAAATIGSKIYLSCKGDNTSVDLWEYDVLTYTWTKREKVPVDAVTLSLFAIKNKLYALGENNKSNIESLAEYTFGIMPSVTPSPSSAPATPTSSNQGSRTISGKVTLKDINLKKDLSIEIFAEQDTGKCYADTITLKRDSLSQIYSISIPEIEISGNYRVGYYIHSDDISLSKTGYYSHDGSVFDVNLSSYLSPKGSDITNIDLNLLKKRTISGTISLPNGSRAPAGGTTVYLELGLPDDAYKNSKHKPDYVYNKTVVIPENQTYAPFSFSVIENNNRYKYVLGYETNSEGCIISGFYNLAGTVSKKSGAGFIDVSSSDQNNIDFKIPGTRYISGILSLPDGVTAPKGGLYVLVSAKGADDGNSTPFLNQFVIPEGSKSLKYFINISDNSVSNLYVNYQVDENGFVKYGYYSDGKTTPYEGNASKVHLGPQNAGNVNLTIIKGRTISGKVYLPESSKAPKDGIDVELLANVFFGNNALLNIQNFNEADLKISLKVTIPENSNSAEYIMTIPQDGYFYIDYFTEQEDFVAHGYYTGSKMSTVYYERKSTQNPSIQDSTNCSLELLKGFKISCSVSLPSGHIAANEIPLLIEFFTANYQAQSFEVAFSKQITISRNSSKIDFQLYLPEGNYYLSYYNPKYSQNKYCEYGFYNSAGSMKDFDFKVQLSVGPNSQNKAILSLIEGTNSPNPSASPGFSPNSGGLTVPVPSIKPGLSSPVPSSAVSPIVTPKPVTTEPKPAVFTDISNHWAKESILSLLTKGIIDGYPDKTIRPDKEITRAEIAKLIVTMLNLAPAGTPDMKFTDKAKIPSWALGYIDVLTRKGIIQGYNDNTFRASNNVTRKEMAVIIMRALGYKDAAPSGPINFKDAKSIPPWAINYVGKGAELGIFNGYTDSTFKPDKYITRAEVFKIIDNSLGFV